jgi:hypothetical protein
MKRLLPALLLGACGDVYADPGGVPSGNDLPIPSIDAVTSRPGPFTMCPSGRPRENTACTSLDACEYGSSSDRACNDVLACNGSTWTRRPSEDCFAYACPPPTSVAALDGQPCSLGEDAGASDSDEAVCDVSDGVCACTTGRDGAHAHPRRWVCARPTTRDCQLPRPRAGEPCAGQIWCDYGSCLFKRGTVMECLNNAWVTGGLRCD